jgi:hypothetical protein
MENEPDCSRFSGRKAASKPAADSKSGTTVGEATVLNWDIDKIVADWQTDALNQRLTLFNILKAEFSMHELNQELAFGLGIDLDDLPSSGKSGKAQELIGFFERRGRIRELLEAAAKLRPDASWG